MASVRFFTPAEAAAIIPQIRPLLQQLREAHHAHHFARAQVEDLRRIYGEAPFQPDHAESAEAAQWVAKMREMAERTASLTQAIRTHGADLKDPLMGLIDFYAERNGETVLLCYRVDEETLEYWHPLTGGYQARRHMREF